jgi:hypothetical protein
MSALMLADLNDTWVQQASEEHYWIVFSRERDYAPRRVLAVALSVQFVQ